MLKGEGRNMDIKSHIREKAITYEDIVTTEEIELTTESVNPSIIPFLFGMSHSDILSNFGKIIKPNNTETSI